MTEKTTLNVTGMSCGHCVKAVEDNLNLLPGVKGAQVHLESGRVEVDFDNSIVGLKKITEAIEKQGYNVTK